MSTVDPFEIVPGEEARPPLALIAGPTASGKSDYAIKLAEALAAQGRSAVIVNADSAQLYADLPILSAAPSPEDTARVRHRLYGAWDGAQGCSAADWAERAREEIAKAHQAGHVPILVGGTGLYMRTLLDGIAPVPAIDPAIREAVRALPVAEAHVALSAEDPERAALLNPADTTRVARALEVVRSTGHSLTYWQAHKEGGIGHAVTLHPMILLPDRDWLYERCDRRFSLMIEGGAVAEVEALLARRLPPDLPVMRAIGVAEIADYLSGDLGLDEAIMRGAQATRNYAKRQYTWFRHQPPGDWPRHAPESHENSDIARHFDRLLQQ
ncbi:tRNA (adenosine(37)-N6)-dimethylallyltransferase MiaA [Novosphingobium terrae]|uniref:tRNA (adenosine(37)-N6)-dimethylallyltransferase MiaA n=1 Tax=Novosphingobium terrae TaxID=2726189 RepID=UPI001F12D0DF|nr:tRNA (adenosine(37)-N6)-dimethylallyltransferase MiaA [Novosphingobium terrae]